MNNKLSAAQRVLGVPELLENVLLYLPLKDLLLAQRISRFFANTTAGSLKTQRALFFEPLQTPTAADVALYQANKNMQLVCGWIPHESVPQVLPRSIPANPLLSKWFVYGDKKCIIPAIPFSYERASLHLNLSCVNAERLAASDNRASWRRILAIQPHVAPLHIMDGSEPGEAVDLAEGFRNGSACGDGIGGSEAQRSLPVGLAGGGRRCADY